MKIFTFAILVGLWMTSCNNSDSSSNTVPKDSSITKPGLNNDKRANLSGCYLRVIKRDSLALHLEEKDGMVMGKLSFDNYEKDGSTGPVKGKVENDIVKLIYNFQSEGMQSIMEIYFKITEKGLIQGIGEVATKSDTTTYANPEKVNYPAGNELLKTSCEVLNAKYK